MNDTSKNNYIISDRRQNRYSFSSQKEMIVFFSTILPKKIIMETIRNMKENFKTREDSSKKDKKMQFLKKCEWELVRLSKKTIINSKELNDI